MPFDKLYKIIRAIIIIIPIIFFGWLLSKDLVVTGRLESVYNFADTSPFILPLAPKARVSEIKEENNYHYQSLFDDPVYFDVRLPRPFKIITLWLTYRPIDSAESVRLAIFTNKDKWEFEVKDFEQIEDLGNGWKRGSATFDLAGKRFVYQKYQGMISLLQIRGSNRQVDVSEIKILAEREPLTVNKVVRKIKGLWYKLIYEGFQFKNH
jgi:hypothetical protein